MSIENVFDEFDKEKKEDETIQKEASEPTKGPEGEGDSVSEGEEESKEEAEKKASTPSEEEDSVDWFGDTVEKPVDEQPVEEDSVDEKAKETPVEEASASETLAEDDDDWFETAVEEPTKDKPAEDQPVEEEPVKEKVDEESPIEETPEAEALAEVDDDWFEPSEEQATAETPSEVSADAVVPMSVEASPIVVPAVSAIVMRASMQQFQSLKASLLDKSDIATIQNKPFIKRSGWRKLALAFNISDEIIKDERVVHNDDFECRIWVKVWAPNGRSVVGIGACSSKERNFAHVEHDVYATAHTRAKNRSLSDLIGSGEVSWEELRGMG